MKWFKWIVGVVLVLVLATAGYAISRAYRAENPVGFQAVRVETGSGPIAVAIWYPTSAAPQPTTFIGGALMSVAKDGPVQGYQLPVVVMSHGNNGSATSHVDLAMDLASAGYVVAAPTHTGDNYADQSRQSSPALFSQRAEQLRSTMDYVLKSWTGAAHVDGGRVGAYGMSAGGFTVLTLVGATPRFELVPSHCRQTSEFICKVLAHTKSPLLTTEAGAGPFAADPRVRAAVVAAPGLGFTFANDGLKNVEVPVQLWWGSQDQAVPFATNAKIIADGLGARAEVHRIEGAQHMSFLAPCLLLKPAGPCTDATGFDRQAVHRSMNADVIAFFNSKLGTATTSGARRHE